MHYYFATKEDLYRAVLRDILALWLAPVGGIAPDRDPAVAIADYIRAKMAASRRRPHASKVFANEILHGAGQIRPFLSEDLRRLVEEKAVVLDAWIAQGRMAAVNTRHVFFWIWAITQHYADFDAQVRAVLDKPRLGKRDLDHATDEVIRFVLRGLGLGVEPSTTQTQTHTEEGSEA